MRPGLKARARSGKPVKRPRIAGINLLAALLAQMRPGLGAADLKSLLVGNAEPVSGPHAAFHRPGDIAGLELAVREMLSRLDADEASIRAAARANAEAAFAPSAVIGELLQSLSTVAGSPGMPSVDAEHDGRRGARREVLRAGVGVE